MELSTNARVIYPNSVCSVVRIFGTKYYHQKTADGGDLWLTDWGWPWKNLLSPERWYDGGRYTRQATRLGFSTGHVYKHLVSEHGRKIEFVIKVSRVAQRVVSGGLLDNTNRERTCFSSPFEEISQLRLLRESRAPQEYLFTKRPLGIFSPGSKIPSWMLDRVPHEFHLASKRIEFDQTRFISDETSKLDPNRDYLTLFSWVVGLNLEELLLSGKISRSEMNAIDHEVRQRLERLGFVVADHKPNHIIVRLDKRGLPRRRHGKLVVALADFELLEQVNRPSFA
jgi:hypothetical protein